jgi:hypothetical protein
MSSGQGMGNHTTKEKYTMWNNSLTMNYGTKALYRHNRKTAKVGMLVTLGFFFRVYGMEGNVVELKRDEGASGWVAHVPGMPFDELFIGGGYDWKICPNKEGEIAARSYYGERGIHWNL